MTPDSLIRQISFNQERSGAYTLINKVYTPHTPSSYLINPILRALITRSPGMWVSQMSQLIVPFSLIIARERQRSL